MIILVLIMTNAEYDDFTYHTIVVVVISLVLIMTDAECDEVLKLLLMMLV